MDEKMRPAINLSWTLHGRVRTYKENKGISLTEAYNVILEEGLKKFSL